jgi:hypothetical protein|tara:strand:- start:78 stop:380 length:303 start_codon:yes stop_codon:yes gene_type:complete
MKDYYGTKMEICNGKLVVNDQDPSPYFRAYLCGELGLTDSRCGDLAKAISQLHSALSRCSFGNLGLICKEFEGLATVCKKYGELEDCQDFFVNSKGEEYK